VECSLRNVCDENRFIQCAVHVLKQLAHVRVGGSAVVSSIMDTEVACVHLLRQHQFHIFSVCRAHGGQGLLINLVLFRCCCTVVRRRHSRMGVCSSKNKKHDTIPSDQVQQKQQAEQKPASLDAAAVPAASTPAAAVGEPSSTAKSADAELVNDGASSEPATPQPAAAVTDGMETPVSVLWIRFRCTVPCTL
jgi:hypothetical protein